MGSQNAIMGDQNFGTDMPETQVDESQAMAEKGMAKFSKSKEFQVMRGHMEGRIKYYQSRLPNGQSIEEGVDLNDWVIANVIINEFNLVITSYEAAAEAVKNAR